MSRRTSLVAALAPALAVVLVASLAVAPATAEPAWSDHEQMSVEMDEYDTDVAMAADGTALVGWVEEIGGVGRAVVRERTLSGEWSTRKVLSPVGGHADHLRVGVDDAGNVTAVWSWQVVGGSTRKIQAVRRATGGAWGTITTLAQTDNEAIDYQNPEVAVSPGGRVAVTWEFENGVSASPRIALPTGPETWQEYAADAQRTGTISDLQSWPDDTGRTTFVWLHDGPDLRVVRANVFGAQPGENETRILSDPEFSPSQPSLAGNAAGRTVVSWTQQLDAGTIRVAATTRSAGSAFPASTVLTDAVTSAARNTTTAVTPAGEAVVVFERANTLFTRSHDGSSWQPAVPVPDAGAGSLEDAAVAAGSTGRLALAWSQVTGEDRRIWSAVRTDGSWGDAQVVSAPGREGRDPVIAASANGDAVVSWRDNDPSRQVGAAGFDGSGPVSAMPALTAVRLTTSVPVAWSAQDRWSAIGDHDVQRRVTPWNGNLGSLSTWLAGTTETSATSAIAVGRTMCFRARARDVHENVGTFTNQRCTTTPVDDRTAVVKGGSWRNYTSSSHYRGTFRSSTTKGSRLEWSGARGKTFDLVAATGPGHGEVAVWLGSRLVKKVSLHRTKARTQVILPLGSLPAVSVGALQVRVVSDGKPVRIDGIAVRR